MRVEDRRRRSIGRRILSASPVLAGFSALLLFAIARSHPRVSVTAASPTRPNTPHLISTPEEPHLAQEDEAPPSSRSQPSREPKSEREHLDAFRAADPDTLEQNAERVFSEPASTAETAALLRALLSLSPERYLPWFARALRVPGETVPALALRLLAKQAPRVPEISAFLEGQVFGASWTSSEARRSAAAILFAHVPSADLHRLVAKLPNETDADFVVTSVRAVEGRGPECAGMVRHLAESHPLAAVREQLAQGSEPVREEEP